MWHLIVYFAIVFIGLLFVGAANQINKWDDDTTFVGCWVFILWPMTFPAIAVFGVCNGILKLGCFLGRLWEENK
jgi:hypothetical protein